MAFGGAVKLTGESEYRKALQQISQGLKEVSAQMKLTTAQYSSNDMSMSALSAKSAVLVDKLELQESKLAILRKQYEAMNEQYAKNASKHSTLLQKYEEEKSKLEYIGATLGTTSKEYKAQEKVVEDLAVQVKKSTDNQDKNAKSMSNMSIEITKAEASVEKTKNAIGQLDSEMEKSAKETANANSAYGKLETTISNQESALEALKNEYASIVLEQGKNSKSAKELEKEMSDLDNELSDNKSKLQEADEASNKLSKSLKDTGDSAEKSSDGFTVLKGAIANLISNGVQKLASAVKNQLGAAVERVDTINSYMRTMENLGYTQEEVAKTTEKLKSGIEGLPTTLPNIMSMQQQYAALGGSIDEATDLTLALNNATLSGGQGQEVANRALDQWYKIIAAGKPNAESWRIINSAMPAQINQIAKSMIGAEANSQDLFTAWKDGKVTTDQMKKSLIDLNKNGGGGMTSFEKQVGGATSGIQTSMANVKTAVANGISEVVEAVGSENIASGFDSFKSVVKDAFSGISSVIKFVIDNKDAFIAGIAGITAGLSTYLVVFKGFEIVQTVTAYINAAKVAFAAFNAVLAANPIGVVVVALAALVAAFVTLWNTSESFRNFWIGLWETIKSTVDIALKTITSWFESAWDNIKTIASKWSEFFGNVWNGIKNVFSGVSTFFRDMFSQGSDSIRAIIGQWDGMFSNVWNGIKNIFGSVDTFFSGAFSKGWEAIKGAFSGWSSFFGSLWNEIKNKFTNIGTNISNAISSSVKSGLNGVISLIEGVINKGVNMINGAIGLINKIPGVRVGSIGRLSLPRLAKGGVLDDGARAVIAGENGAEAIVPLENNTKWIKKVAKELSKMELPRENAENNILKNFEYKNMIEAFKEALGQMSVEMDDITMGKFVEKTVAKAIYN